MTNCEADLESIAPKISILLSSAELGQKEKSQPADIIPFIFHFYHIKDFFIYYLFHCDFIGDWHTPNCGIPAIG